jgi:hypothetical protein
MTLNHTVRPKPCALGILLAVFTALAPVAVSLASAQSDPNSAKPAPGQLGGTLSLPKPPTAPAPTGGSSGGYGGFGVRAGDGTGFFRTQKVGDRWILVTPDGYAFWMRAVSVVDWGDGGATSAEVFRSKYKGDQAAFAAHAKERLHSWGFNAIGPYSNIYTMPVPTNMRPPTSGQQLPFIRLLNVSWYGSIHEPGTDSAKWELAPAPFKTLLTGAVDYIIDGVASSLPLVRSGKFRALAKLNNRPLPTLPLWLADALVIPLDLEQSYEQACHDLWIT